MAENCFTKHLALHSLNRHHASPILFLFPLLITTHFLDLPTYARSVRANHVNTHPTTFFQTATNTASLDRSMHLEQNNNWHLTDTVNTQLTTHVRQHHTGEKKPLTHREPGQLCSLGRLNGYGLTMTGPNSRLLRSFKNVTIGWENKIWSISGGRTYI